MWCCHLLLRSWVTHVIANMWLMFYSLWVYLTSFNSISSVKMISAEAPVLFAKAAQIFITELTLRAWIHTEDNKRRTLQVRNTRRDVCEHCSWHTLCTHLYHPCMTDVLPWKHHAVSGENLSLHSSLTFSSLLVQIVMSVYSNNTFPLSSFCIFLSSFSF